MRTISWLSIILVAGALVCATGCKKAEKPSEWTTGGSVRVSLPELQQAFADTTAPDVQRCLSDAALALRYGRYDNVLAALNKLANRPDLTTQQKKLTNEVISQVKQLAAKAQSK